MWSPTTGSIPNASRDTHLDCIPPLYPLYPSKPPWPPGAYPDRMFPYKNRLKWWISARQAHLADGIDDQAPLYDGDRGEQLRRRVRGLRRWLKVRIVAIVFLSFSIVATIVSAILNLIPATAELEAGLALSMRIASTFAGVITLVYLFTVRTLGQLEIDALLLLQLQTRHL